MNFEINIKIFYIWFILIFFIINILLNVTSEFYFEHERNYSILSYYNVKAYLKVKHFHILNLIYPIIKYKNLTNF